LTNLNLLNWLTLVTAISSSSHHRYLSDKWQKHDSLCLRLSEDEC
jgi:hypothetical protein